MVNFPGRNDRRRRVLKEEVLSPSGARTPARVAVSADAAADVPRYSEAAGVENHPQVTDFVPRRFSSIALLVVFGATLTAAGAASHYFVLPIAVAHGINSAAVFDLASPGNLVSWLSAVVLFVASGFCVMTYSIRRHRIDDFRGRYRIWLAAALACLVLSANSVAGLHDVLADVMTRFTGWSALRSRAAWWLIMAGVPLAWIYIRVLLDIRECHVGLALLVGSAISYAASAASFLGYGPAAEPRVQPLLVVAPLLWGHWLMFTAIVANARFVVLDAQGLVTAKRRVPMKRAASLRAEKSAPKLSVPSGAATSATSSADIIARHMPQAAKRPADSGQWVDGTRPERVRYSENDSDDDSSDGDRKLSKADRKRLRKLKIEGRAA